MQAVQGSKETGEEVREQARNESCSGWTRVVQQRGRWQGAHWVLRTQCLPPRSGSIRQIMGKLPFSVSSDGLEFGRGVRTPLPNLRFEELLNWWSMRFSDLLYTRISAKTLSDMNLELDIRVSTMGSHPINYCFWKKILISDTLHFMAAHFYRKLSHRWQNQQTHHPTITQ